MPTAVAPAAVTVIGVPRHGKLLRPAVAGLKLARSTQVNVYLTKDGTWIREWHTNPRCAPPTKKVTTSVGALLDGQVSEACDKCTLTARLHFIVTDTHTTATTSPIATLVTCRSRSCSDAYGRCVTCEVLTDVAALAGLELVTLHDAPHRGLLTQTPDDARHGYEIYADLTFTTVHHSTPDPLGGVAAGVVAAGGDRAVPPAAKARREYLEGHNKLGAVRDLTLVDRELLATADALDPERAWGAQNGGSRQLYLDVAAAVRDTPRR